jgi:hypothetical protein
MKIAVVAAKRTRSSEGCQGSIGTEGSRLRHSVAEQRTRRQLPIMCRRDIMESLRRKIWLAFDAVVDGFWRMGKRISWTVM